MFVVYARVNSQKWEVVGIDHGTTVSKVVYEVYFDRISTTRHACVWLLVMGLWMMWLKGLHRHKRMAHSSSRSSNVGRGRPMAIYEILWTMWHPISIRRTIIASGKITIFWRWSHHYNLIHSSGVYLRSSQHNQAAGGIILDFLFAL